MPQYLTPGVFIEEIPGPKPIEGVGTATGAFIGIAERGPIGEAMLITNMTQYIDVFGGFIPHGYLTYAVQQFFTEGGTKCYVTRTCHYTDITNATTKTAKAATIKLQDRASTPNDTLEVTALSEGNKGDFLAVEIDDGKKENTFKLTVLFKGAEAEAFDELTIEDVESKINGESKWIKVDISPGGNVPSPTPKPDNQPKKSVLVLKDRAAAPKDTLKVSALDDGLTITIADSGADKFKVTVKRHGELKEEYDGLTMESVERRINGVSQYLKVTNLGSATAAPANRPALKTDEPVPFYNLTGGWDGLGGLSLNDRAATTRPTLLVSAFKDGITMDVVDQGADKFKIVVKENGTARETFENLIMADVEERINGFSAYIYVNNLNSPTAAPNNRPTAGTSMPVSLGLADTDFIGNENAKNGLHAFDSVDDINIMARPDRAGDREVIIAAYTYCKNRKDCFFVADPPLGLTPQGALNFKQGKDAYAGAAFNSAYAALYYPWVHIVDPLDSRGRSKLVPPSGAVVGRYSATDVRRGVFKAPAGTIDGNLGSVVNVERLVTKGDQELLNPEGVNVIRSFPASGIVIWGARTISSDAEWKYVSVRRLLLMIEESIDKGTQWVVFEPNTPSLWASVKRDISAFLTVQWREGALFGTSPEEAFFVKVDAENNPPETRDLGRLYIDVGVAPVKPAEFVIIRFSQKTLEA